MEAVGVKLPRITQHFSEIVLLGLIALGVIWLLGKAIDKSGDNSGAYDLAAFLLVLQAIITAIKDRWTQRSVDRMGEHVAQSAPSNEHLVTEDVSDAADQVAHAADNKADQIKRRVAPRRSKTGDM